LGERDIVTVVRVLAAVICREDRFLICQRPAHKRHGRLWEFPGGKVEANESDLEAARRELAEELGVVVSTIGQVEFTVRDVGSDFLIEFVPVTIEGEPDCHEHSALAWPTSSELLSYDLAPSDRKYAEFIVDGATNNDDG
jgi:mutator protein MutT